MKQQVAIVSPSALQMSSSAASPPDIKHIGKEAMKELLEDYENRGREETKMVVIDVRSEGEIQMTGKLSPSVHTLPVEAIAQYEVFALDEDEFENLCGFPKPTMDETIVFSCAAGVRSVYACNFAAQHGGYTNLVNYAGGANEWFAPF